VQEGEAMKEIEELFRKLRHHYRLFLKGSNDSFIKMNEIETALLSRFRELDEENARLFNLTGTYNSVLQKYSLENSELKQRAEQAKDKDEAVKSVRIQYDSVCEMFHRKEKEYEDRIIDLNNELVNQIEVGKQKNIYINQLQEQVERLKCLLEERK
jgi:hypothetical protein